MHSNSDGSRAVAIEEITNSYLTVESFLLKMTTLYAGLGLLNRNNGLMDKLKCTETRRLADASEEGRGSPEHGWGVQTVGGTGIRTYTQTDGGMQQTYECSYLDVN